MLIYVSGKYSGDVASNIGAARSVACKLWEMGHSVICPHTNTANFETFCKADYDDYIKGDLDMIARCDAMVMVDGWMTSKGAVIENEYAKRLGISIYFESSLPPLHPTEVRCPEQVMAFRELCGKMYRTHLDKNSDYSPANILATGEIGLATRLWDKTARLLNLIGFRFSIVDAGIFEAPREPKHESIEDTYIDLAVYALIGLLLRKKVWGR